MKFNFKILAACLSEVEGKTVSEQTARHVSQRIAKGANAARLLAALPAYKEAIGQQCFEAQNGLNSMEAEVKAAAFFREAESLKRLETRLQKQPNIALIGGAETHFDRVGKRKLRGEVAQKFTYLGAGEILQISGWQSRRFKVGAKAMFWKKSKI